MASRRRRVSAGGLMIEGWQWRVGDGECGQNVILGRAPQHASIRGERPKLGNPPPLRSALLSRDSAAFDRGVAVNQGRLLIWRAAVDCGETIDRERSDYRSRELIIGREAAQSLVLYKLCGC